MIFTYYFITSCARFAHQYEFENHTLIWIIAAATRFLVTRYLGIIHKSILTSVTWPLAHWFSLDTWAFHPSGSFGLRTHKDLS